jgi:hypothetical protein
MAAHLPTTFADLTIAVAESLTGPLGFEAINRLRRNGEGPYQVLPLI